MFVARYNSAGNCLGVAYAGQGLGYDVVTILNGSCVVAGILENSMQLGITNMTSIGGNDIFVAKLEEITGIQELKPSKLGQLEIYSNPNAGQCTIQIPDKFKNEKNLKLSIYDSQGKIIQQISLDINSKDPIINLEQQAKGIYPVLLSNGITSFSGKIIFE